MNFLFISPNYPAFYYKFCRALKEQGIRVFGIGDSDKMSQELRECLVEYFVVHNMQDFKAVQSICEHIERVYGKIDFVDSNNEFWLELEGSLRDHFGIPGLHGSLLFEYKHKSMMKGRFAKAGIPVSQWIKSCDRERIISFCELQGMPIFSKPDSGVGAVGVKKISERKELDDFLETHATANLIFEPYVEGDLYSFDGLCDKDGDIVFSTCHRFDTPIDKLKESGCECVYYTMVNVPPVLEKVGRAAVSAFELKNRFFHIEFFQLTKPLPGVGEIGEFVALEANMRIAGGYTPEMMRESLGLDIYALWAAVMSGDKPDVAQFRHCKNRKTVVNVSRSDRKKYLFEIPQIQAFFKNEFMLCERTSYDDNPFGNHELLAAFEDEQRMQIFVEMVTKISP